MSNPRLVGVRIDIETKSRTDIKAGAYRYCEDPEFEVLITAYTPIRQYAGGARKLGRVRVLDESDATEVSTFTRILHDDNLEKHAFNANFERICLSKWRGFPNGIYLDPKNWHCTAIRANVNGVFGTLDEVGRALRSPTAKDREGKRLIRLFCSPEPKSKRFHDTHGVCWCGANHEADFARFQKYCCQDVVAEAMVARLLSDVPSFVQAEYEADQRINDRGIRHFSAIAKAAMGQVEVEKNRLMGELKVLTGVDNPNSGKQMNEWLDAQNYSMASLDKAHREAALVDPMIPDVVAKALVLKGQASLSSVTKHKAALNTRCADGRIRGSLQFYGAHTGREAGRGIQPQNLPRYEAPISDIKRLLAGTAGADAPTIAKGSVRASLVPARPCDFVTFDYNAIEARCLGWLTGETWVNAEFAGAGKIYEATAAMMFGVEKIALVEQMRRCGKCGKCAACAVRAKAKVSNLALGYAGGAGALVTMGAEASGIDIGNYNELHAEWVALGRPGKFWQWESDRHDYPELKRLRDLYRDASPATVGFWKLCGRAWDLAASGTGARFGANRVVTIMRDGKHNRMVLPSGRSIWYRFARSHMDLTNPERVDRRTFIGKSGGIGHTRVDTHGGKLTENVTQAVARDVLFDLIMRIEDRTHQGWPAKTVLHVHDEVVLEVPKKHTAQVMADLEGMMAVPPTWAPGLVVKGEGSVMRRYGK